VEPRIGEDNFQSTRCGWITVKNRLKVLRDSFKHACHPLDGHQVRWSSRLLKYCLFLETPTCGNFQTKLEKKSQDVQKGCPARPQRCENKAGEIFQHPA
jgi:hypothetical protein